MSPKNPKTIDEAITKLKACREREEAKYGRQVKELGRLSDEAPAPDPCVDAFNRLVQEIFNYGGGTNELELGEFRQEVGRAMATRRAVKNE
jgi:hypothetical protein